MSNGKGSTALRLRPARREDYVEIAAWIDDAQACLRWAGPLVSYPFSFPRFPMQLAVQGGASYALVSSDDELIGFGQHWVQSPASVHLGRLIVAPGRRGQGLGRWLCERLGEVAVEATGAAYLTLRVFRDNEAAVRVYRSLGYEPVEAESDASVLYMRAPTPVAR